MVCTQFSAKFATRVPAPDAGASMQRQNALFVVHGGTGPTGPRRPRRLNRRSIPGLRFDIFQVRNGLLHCISPPLYRPITDSAEVISESPPGWPLQAPAQLRLAVPSSFE